MHIPINSGSARDIARALREGGLKFDDIARLLGVSKAQAWHWACGVTRPRAKMRAKLARKRAA